MRERMVVPKRVFWLATLVPVILSSSLLLACTGGELMPIQPEVLGDDSGGAIVTWIHKSTIYAKRLNGEGSPLWSETAVSLKPAIPSSHKMVTDGSGGAIVVWMDSRTQDSEGEDIYAQKISTDGTLAWKESGVPVCVGPGHQAVAAIVSDSAGGAVVVWTDIQNNRREIYVQRLDATGKALWQENGVRLVATGAYLDEVRAVGDGLGGIMIVWVDGRGNDYDIYTQHVDYEGRALWRENGIAIGTSPGYQRNPLIVSDGIGGAVIVWHNSDASPATISAQRVTSEGKVLWQEDGVVIAPANESPKIISTGQKEVIMAWVEMPGPAATAPQWALYVQKFNLEGIPQWGKEPLVLSSAVDQRLDTEVDSDSSGGLFVVWRVGIGPHKGGEIYTQKLDSEGNPLWKTSMPVYSTGLFKYQGFPQVVSDGSGGAILISVLGRSSDAKDLIYAQRIDSRGNRLWGEGIQVNP